MSHMFLLRKPKQCFLGQRLQPQPTAEKPGLSGRTYRAAPSTKSNPYPAFLHMNICFQTHKDLLQQTTGLGKMRFPLRVLRLPATLSLWSAGSRVRAGLTFN